ncbi:unnamed protein product [Peronospora effusa]|nr:unnamed protein product [Peronospora effusa]CAI5713465.1 unnamed protein product [Peronospora effusa]
MSLTSHIRLGATGDLPVFNTRGTERFETSSMSLSFGPNSEYDSTLGETRVARRPQVCDLNKARIALETTQGLAYLYAPNPWCCSTT